MIEDIALFNGKIIKGKEATLFVDDIEFLYGFGVYENLKVRNNILYFPQRHINRLITSAKELGINLNKTKEELLSQLHTFKNAIKKQSYNIKIICIGRKESADIYIVGLNPKFVEKRLYNEGIRVITYYGERQFPKAKTLNMTLSYVALQKAREKGAYDTLLVHQDETIPEGTRANLFFTDGKTLFTPPQTNLLNGVTRQTLIEALEQKGIKVQDKVLKKDELTNYSGFFLTSTSAKILPITKIDEHTFKIPPITKETIKIYSDYLKTYTEPNS